MATTLLRSDEALRKQYQAGDVSVILAALSEVPVVKDEDLTWEQVHEFRRDPEAKRKYRAFVTWLDESMIGCDATYIADKIAQRLDDYKWSIKKHGLRAASGVLKNLIDPRFVATTASGTTAAGVVGGPVWGAVAAGVAVLAAAGVAVTTEAIDLAEAQRASRDIAFVRELEDLKKQ